MNNKLFEKFEKELRRTVTKLGNESMNFDELTYTEAMIEAVNVITEEFETRLYELQDKLDF